MNGRSVQFKWTLGFTDEADGIPERMYSMSTVSSFGRSTPVELEFSQVEKVK